MKYGSNKNHHDPNSIQADIQSLLDFQEPSGGPCYRSNKQFGFGMNDLSNRYESSMNWH